ncbi:alpha-N-arabinofuranosidase [Phenylobacterium deserti]|uniref:alpha-N-arabinofuranosidase n=1 Tax=Phenylobacterium deserti TaxID=1914756 RepID=UPI0023E7C3F2|nr:alpha-L-arabinofuranosidase C-terminal domain-containing protein [Phenylobacterium deserti]
MKSYLAGAALAAACLFASPVLAQAPSASLAIQADRPGPKIDRRIFGQFAEHLGTGIYDGVWVGPKSKIPNTRGYRNDVVAALKELKVPVVRWPGGCFADEYHWREGIGPRNKRPVKINTNWGGVTEDNAFGTHEFMDFAEMIGAEAYISGNVGNGTPAEMAEWIEYITAPAGSLADLRAKNGRKQPWKLEWFGIGNELWGCGGNMRPEYAADVTKRYSTFIKVPAGTKTMRIASGASHNMWPWAEYNWTEVMMREAADQIDGTGVHYYTFPGGMETKGSATEFDEEAWARTIAKTIRMDEYITGHEKIMDKYDPQKKKIIAVDEWGAWHDPAPGSNPGFLQQQNTLRDAMVAALNINIFTRHAERVKLANIAQMINVLQAMILTDGPKMTLTPTYHVFEMYKPFQDAVLLPVDLKSSWYHKDQWAIRAVDATAARGVDGKTYVALVNVDPNQPASVTANLAGLTATRVSGRVLSAPTMQAHNTFDQPNAVRPAAFNGAQLSGGALNVTLPAKSVVVLTLE